MSTASWIRPEQQLPERGQQVEWIPPSGGEPINGTYNKMWFYQMAYTYTIRPHFGDHYKQQLEFQLNTINFKMRFNHLLNL